MPGMLPTLRREYMHDGPLTHAAEAAVTRTADIEVTSRGCTDARTAIMHEIMRVPRWNMLPTVGG